MRRQAGHPFSGRAKATRFPVALIYRLALLRPVQHTPSLPLTEPDDPSQVLDRLHGPAGCALIEPSRVAVRCPAGSSTSSKYSSTASARLASASSIVWPWLATSTSKHLEGPTWTGHDENSGDVRRR
jgi:hypothetical protein